MKDQSRRSLPGVLFLVALGATACGSTQPMGDANALIVGTSDGAWEEVQEDVEAALEPRAFTVRDERIFRVTQVDPTGPYWRDMRRFRQILLIGEPGDAWIAEALAQTRGPLPSLPAVVEARNVWARNQRVLAMVVPPGAPVAAARPLLPVIGESMLAEYQESIRQRMFTSGVDTAQAAALRAEAGFSLRVPNVYRTEQPEPNTYVFINDQPDPSRLQRSVLVTSRPAGEVSLEQDVLLAWREGAARRLYDPPQATERARIEVQELDPQRAAFQVQGLWSSLPGAWPAGGPFITRAVECPDGRTFLLDAWVYAPGTEKYPYLLQLQTILDSFECAAQRAR